MKELIALLTVGLFAAVGWSGDKELAWPRFRGPEGTGVADVQTPPVELGPDTNGGAVAVLKGGTAKPVVVAKNPKLGERVVATPAIADNALYIRTDKHLYAFAGKK